MKLKISGNTPGEVKPAEGAFYDPPFRDHLEFGGAFVGSEYDFKVHPVFVLDTFRKNIPAISAICKKLPKPAALVQSLSDKVFGYLAVMDIRCGYDYRQRQPEYVNRNALLPSLNLLVAVNSALGIDMAGRANALGVDDSKACLSVSSHAFPHAFPQIIHYGLDMSLEHPLSEIEIHRLPWCEAVRDHAPLAACYRYVEESVHDFFQIVLSFSGLWIKFLFNN